MCQKYPRIRARTGEKWVIILSKFSNWDVKPRVVFVDGVVMTFETTGVPEQAVALGTWNHGHFEGKFRVSEGICTV